MLQLLHVPRLAVFASRSSAPRQWDLPTFVDATKASGFAGVEISLAGLLGDGGSGDMKQKALADAIKSQGLQLIVNISSVPSITSATPSSPLDHVRTFESQLHRVSALGDVVSHINCTESGDNRWDVATSAEYLGEVLPLSAQFLEENPHIGQYGRETDIMGGSPHHLTGISHETNARGMLHHPDVVRDLMEILPPIRITSDIQQWHDICGYQWGFGRNEKCGDDCDEELEALKVEIVPHVDHIRASMIGGTLATDDAVAPHEQLERFVWSRKAKRGVEQVTITPDLHTTSASNIAGEDNLLWEQTKEAADCIRRSYDDWKESYGDSAIDKLENNNGDA